mmetsp:Transcript_45439/g.98090  ORF Transcript_45439/g.98090 Transcript_45439/m.98090 type:complete len:434 (-) Transcript_45439:760-2061(-)
MLRFEEGGPLNGQAVHVNVGDVGDERAGASDVLQDREDGADTLSHANAGLRRGRNGDVGDGAVQETETSVDGGGVDPNSRSMKSSASSDLDGLAGTHFGGSVAGVAGLVWVAGGREQRRVRGALVDDFDGEAEGEPDPSDHQGDEADLDAHPGRGLTLLAEGLVHVATLLLVGDCAAGGDWVALGGPKFADDVVFTLLQLQWGSDQPDGMLEGQWQAPLGGPPRRAGLAGDGGGLLRWGTQAVQGQCVDDVDGVADVHQDETDALAAGVEPALVLDEGGEVGEPEAEGTNAVDRHAPGDDVEGEDDLLEDEHGEHDDGACPHRAHFLEEVADLEVGPAVDQVHEGEEDGEAGVDVIGEPLHLELTVGLEVLGGIALSRQWHHRLDRLGSPPVVDGLLLLVPGGDVVAVASACLGLVIDVEVLVESTLLALLGT